MQSAREALEDTRYQRLQHLIDTKFTDDKILSLLDCFESRNDDEIRSMVTDNADIPTIFESYGIKQASDTAKFWTI